LNFENASYRQWRKREHIRNHLHIYRCWKMLEMENGRKGKYKEWNGECKECKMQEMY